MEEAQARTRFLSPSRAGLALGLVGLVLAVFLQVRHHEFVDYDDLAGIAHNPVLRADSPGEALRAAFTSRLVSNWIPLTVLSFQLDHWLWGLEPGAVLLTNVALHALASVLLFAALWRMTAATGASAFVAAVFAVHPLHVESVAWASERKDVLAGLFWMLALSSHARACAPGARPGRRAWTALWMALGLLAKPVLVTLPFALLLLDAWPLRRLGRPALREKLALFTLSGLFSAIALWVQHQSGATAFGEAIPFGARAANAVDAVTRYLAQSFWPKGLAVIYPHSLGSLAPLRLALGAGGVALVTAAAWILRRERPHLLVGWLWFLGTLVPVLGLVQVGVQARADRYTYLPMIGLALALAFEAERWARGRWRRAAAGAGLAAVAALAALAHGQVGVWRSSEALFARALEISPDSHAAHLRVATLRLREGRLDAAEEHYRRAHALAPRWAGEPLLRFHLGMASRRLRRGDPEGAVARYRAALEIDPGHGRTNAQLGLLLAALSRFEAARPHLSRGLPWAREHGDPALVTQMEELLRREHEAPGEDPAPIP